MSRNRAMSSLMVEPRARSQGTQGMVVVGQGQAYLDTYLTYTREGAERGEAAMGFAAPHDMRVQLLQQLY